MVKGIILSEFVQTEDETLKPQKETLLKQCGFDVDDRRFMPPGRSVGHPADMADVMCHKEFSSFGGTVLGSRM